MTICDNPWEFIVLKVDLLKWGKKFIWPSLLKFENLTEGPI